MSLEPGSSVERHGPTLARLYTLRERLLHTLHSVDEKPPSVDAEIWETDIWVDAVADNLVVRAYSRIGDTERSYGFRISNEDDNPEEVIKRVIPGILKSMSGEAELTRGSVVDGREIEVLRRPMLG